MNKEIPSDYTRVTEILGRYTNLSSIPQSVLENAADRGKRVHALCEKYLKNPHEFHPFLIEIIDDDCKGYFQSFLRWYENAKFTPFIIEKRLYDHELKITGQIDLIGSYDANPEELILVDFKTPQNSSKTWNLQTAAYKMLAQTDLSLEIDRRACLQLDKNGKTPRFVEFFDHEKDEELFLSAYDLHNFFY